MDSNDESQNEATAKSPTGNVLSEKRAKFKKLLETMTRRKFFKLFEHKLTKYTFIFRNLRPNFSTN